MPDRLQEIRARLNAQAGTTKGTNERMVWVSDREYVMQDDYQRARRDFIAHAPADIAWLLDEVERLRNTKASSPNTLCDESVVQDVTKLECSDG